MLAIAEFYLNKFSIEIEEAGLDYGQAYSKSRASQGVVAFNNNTEEIKTNNLIEQRQKLV